MNIWRILLFPFSIIYALIVFIRNCLFDSELIRSSVFQLPVISVGNLVAGGSGKTPMVEYLVRLLKDQHRIAILSRGYGRKTKGYLEASSLSTVEDIGDEPAQFKRKFNHVTVAVCEHRAVGIDHLKDTHELILLDDAFQHRAVKPSLSILLYDYTKVFNQDFLLPVGNLREFKSGMKRADILLVTKTPKIFSPMERRRVEGHIGCMSHQKVFYSYLKYGALVALSPEHTLEINRISEMDKKTPVVLLTGIANPDPIKNILDDRFRSVRHIAYPDHYKFTVKDIEKLTKVFAGIDQPNKLIITTEKDAMRLSISRLKASVDELPIFYLPIEAELHEKDKQEFDQLIMDHVRANKVNYKIY